MRPMTYVMIAGKRYPMRMSTAAVKAIVERFGSMEKMSESVKGAEEDTVGAMDTVVFLLAVLINQGCAYKNLFEPTIPPEDDAPIENGKYVPLTKEEIEVATDISDFKEMTQKIFEVISAGNKPQLETEQKSKGKNAKTT